MKKLLLLTTALCFLVLSCKKEDQKAVDNLDGNWKMTNLVVTGLPGGISLVGEFVYTFESCKIRKDDCSGLLKKNGELVTNFSFSFKDDGQTFVATSTSGSTSEIPVDQPNETTRVFNFPNRASILLLFPGADAFEQFTELTTATMTLEKQ